MPLFCGKYQDISSFVVGICRNIVKDLVLLALKCACVSEHKCILCAYI